MHQIKQVFVHKDFCFKKCQSSTFRHSHASTLTIHDIPQRKSLPVIGTKLEFIAAGSGTKLHEYIDQRHKQLGTVFREKLGSPIDLVFVSDPDLIRTLLLSLEGKYPAHLLPEPWMLYEQLHGSKRGLFFMNGEEWLVNRRIMNKHLLKVGSDDWLEKPIKATISKFIENMANDVNDGCTVPDLEFHFYRLSINVIIATMLGNEHDIKFNQHYDSLLNVFAESVKKIFKTTTKLYGLPIDVCQKLNLKIWNDFKESVDTSLSLAHKIVGEILANKQHSSGLVKILSDENVSDDDIKKIIGDFVIAAGDTTAYTSLWSLYLLSKDNNVNDEIRARGHNYVNCVLKESMRLYPVAPFLTRILPKQSILGSYELNAGTPVIASIYTSGRDDKNFSRADKFLPYRWDRSDVRRKDLVNHISFASLPFALGARSCIGKKLAILQMTELITQIVNTFDLKCLNEHEVNANTSQVLVPNTDIKLEFSLRKQD